MTQRGVCLICRKREIAVFCDLNDLNIKAQQSPLLKDNYTLYPEHRPVEGLEIASFSKQNEKRMTHNLPAVCLT